MSQFVPPGPSEDVAAKHRVPVKGLVPPPSRKLLERSGRCDAVLIGVGVVVLFEVGEAVHVVHRQTVRSVQPRGGRVAHPIETLQPRAVGEMKARDRILRADARMSVDIR